MDAARFDGLAKSLSVAGSRRGTLGGLLLGALGLLTGTDAQDAAARKCKKIKNKKKRKKCLAKAKDTTTQEPTTPAPASPPPPPLGGCSAGQRLCNGACIPANQCCTDADCPDAEPRCCRGACLSALQCCDDSECRAGRLCCNGACRLPDQDDPKYDPECATDSDCCSNYCELQWDNLKLCRPCRGKVCAGDQDCCLDQPCIQRPNGVKTCGGCLAAGGLGCQQASDCCSTDCVPNSGSLFGGSCESRTGGPCATDSGCAHCLAHWESHRACYGICQDGRCDCPEECCFNSDCPPGYVCQNATCRVILE